MQRKVATNDVDAGRAAGHCGNRDLNQLFDFFDDSWSGAVTTMRWYPWYREAILKIQASSWSNRAPHGLSESFEHLFTPALLGVVRIQDLGESGRDPSISRSRRPCIADTLRLVPR